MFFRSLAVLVPLLTFTGCIFLQPPQLRAATEATAACTMARSDERWLRQVLESWPRVTARYLKAQPLPLPMLVVFDARCSYRSTPRASPPRWTASEHKGHVAIPNGPTFPSALQASFYSFGADGFLLMSLPSVWQSVAPPSKIPLDQFVEGIFFHELAHSFQAQATPSVWFLALQQQGFSPENLGDDDVQERFAKDSTYAADYRKERDLLYRAAATPLLADARALTCSALAKMRSRRARYFTGANAGWARVDEVSLTTEGLGQWVAFAWLTKGRKLRASLVLSKLRGPFWSQDEGLAIFLVLDRLVPNWQKSLLSASPVTVEGQLSRACTGS